MASLRDLARNCEPLQYCIELREGGPCASSQSRPDT